MARTPACGTCCVLTKSSSDMLDCLGKVTAVYTVHSKGTYQQSCNTGVAFRFYPVVVKAHACCVPLHGMVLSASCIAICRDQAGISSVIGITNIPESCEETTQLLAAVSEAGHTIL